MRRTITATAVALALVLAGSLLASTPAGASSSDEAWFVQQINNHRSGLGLAPLQVDGGLTSGARAWSASMSRSGLAHDPNIGSSVSGWLRIGENVGYGTSRDQIWQWFLSSSQHRSNFEQGAYTHVGVGVVSSGGFLWVTQRFMQVGSTAPPANPTPPVVVAPAPAPPIQVVPAPAPQPSNAGTSGGGSGGAGGNSGAGSNGGGATASGAGADAGAASATTSTTVAGPADAERVSLMIDALHALG